MRDKARGGGPPPEAASLRRRRCIEKLGNRSDKLRWREWLL
jgi:hypothetical protein